MHHVGYLGNDLLFVVSSDCALRMSFLFLLDLFFYLFILFCFVLVGQGPDKGDFIICTAVSDVRHNRNHDKLGQFYVTIRK
jgi:hypothetical protein